MGHRGEGEAGAQGGVGVCECVRFPEAIKFCAKQAGLWYLCLEVTSVQLFLSGPPCPSLAMTNRGPE